MMIKMIMLMNISLLNQKHVTHATYIKKNVFCFGKLKKIFVFKNEISETNAKLIKCTFIVCFFNFVFIFICLYYFVLIQFICVLV